MLATVKAASTKRKGHRGYRTRDPEASAPPSGIAIAVSILVPIRISVRLSEDFWEMLFRSNVSSPDTRR